MSGKKGEKNLSIPHGDNAPALLQCLGALFLVQTYSDVAASPIKNLSMRRENLRAAPGDRLKLQNNPAAGDAKFNAKKIIFTVVRRQGKIIHS
ncbi:hypothetical protein [Pantoea agglomerans]|uniref:hypothetical protein n=1 Tax=Enterobacter agglomerans TaxID=549 RepID=UPI001ABAB6AC|nr:hypothetical protein [Pantoea agglomerans]